MTDLAARLCAARDDGGTVAVTDGVRPATPDEAYALQARVVEAMGAPIIGFKVGATAAASMSTLGLDQPFHGPLFERYRHPSGATVALPGAHAPKLETEFVVGLGGDLPPTGAPYSVEQVREAVAWVSPGFELVGTRFATELPGAGTLAIADVGANIGMVEGDRVSDWRRFDLADHPVTLTINGEPAASGHAGLSMWGNALGAVAWLASHPSVAPRGLRAGDLVMTGTCTGILPLSPGDVAHADFGALGAVRATFEIG